MANSVFPSVGTWWVGNGLTVGSGKLVRTGSSTTPFDADAVSVGGSRWTFEIIYTANVDTQVAIRANWFGAGKKNLDKQDYVTTQNLSAGTTRAVKLELRIPSKGYPLWTPSLAVPSTAAEITFHKVTIYETPKPGLEIVDTVTITGTGGAMGRLSFPNAKVDDLVVIFYASQFGNTEAKGPTGWDVEYNKNINGRSGYVAAKRVVNDAEIHAIQVGGDTISTARERALCFLLRRVGTYKIHGWEPTEPELATDVQNLIAAQYHGNNKTPLVPWQEAGETSYSTGGASTTQSWSSIEAGISSKIKAGSNAFGFAYVALAPLVPEIPEKKTPGVAIVEGETNNPVFIYDNNGLQPATIRAVPRGYKDIGTMMITRGFLIAHHGGSVSWPEASMRAYTNAVMFGAGALEVSCQKTKDGVWVINHDRTIQRVDPTAPSTPVTEMTWAELNKYHTIGEPFVKVEEYFAAYGSSHITVLDPKFSAVQWQELKQFFPSDAKGRIIWKFSIDAGWLANQWKADGWKCWGYSYPEHVTDGRINEWAKPWDYIGMSFDASDEVWKKTVALGKPVWAHVCPTKKSYDDGLAKGAIGCMVSGVANIYSESLV